MHTVAHHIVRVALLLGAVACATAPTSGGVGSGPATQFDAAAADSSAAASDGGTKTDTVASSVDVAQEVSAVTGIEIAGTWLDNFGAVQIVGEKSWDTGFGIVAIVDYDNKKNRAYTQSPPDDPYTANLFSKVVWTEPKADQFWFCIVDYGKATLALAQASSATADDKDPDKTGCGGAFPWTKMTRKK